LGLDLSIITNGQNLVKERAEVLTKAKWVRVSMDYTNGQQMKQFRNVSEKSFDSVINNLSKFAAIKNKDCDLAVNYIVHNKNFENLFEFSKLLKAAGVNNVRYSPMYIPNFYEYHNPIAGYVANELLKIQALTDETFTVNTTYKIAPGTSHSHNRSYTRCYTMQTVPVIGADLKVYTCHNKAYDTNGVIGSIKDKSFKELWFSNETLDYMLQFNPKKKCLHECSADRKNIIVNDFLDANQDNFV
jgi:sulfatase maturation enzyme AslB (radical SAM superfamily)